MSESKDDFFANLPRAAMSPSFCRIQAELRAEVAAELAAQERKAMSESKDEPIKPTCPFWTKGLTFGTCHLDPAPINKYAYQFCSHHPDFGDYLAARKAKAIDTRSLAEKLHAAREAANLSLVELARRSGVSKTYIWELENDALGLKRPSLSTIEVLAEALDVPITEFLKNPASLPQEENQK